METRSSVSSHGSKAEVQAPRRLRASLSLAGRTRTAPLTGGRRSRNPRQRDPRGRGQAAHVTGTPRARLPQPVSRAPRARQELRPTQTLSAGARPRDLARAREGLAALSKPGPTGRCGQGGPGAGEGARGKAAAPDTAPPASGVRSPQASTCWKRSGTRAWPAIGRPAASDH